MIEGLTAKAGTALIRLQLASRSDVACGLSKIKERRAKTESGKIGESEKSLMSERRVFAFLVYGDEHSAQTQDIAFSSFAN